MSACLWCGQARVIPHVLAWVRPMEAESVRMGFFIRLKENMCVGVWSASMSVECTGTGVTDVVSFHVGVRNRARVGWKYS